ncbi:ABC transporter permease [Mycoplasmopsis adleri]|uniref:ABC transporter permease n=1 Tax=Mycoplasmopsis adleri TaxID=51362 RepID=UPI003872DD47
MYSYSFGVVLLSIFYGSLKATNIFKDLDNEGIELLIYSKPISRNEIIWGKILTFLFLGLIWSLISLIAMLFVFLTIANLSSLKFLVPLSFIVPYLAYILFGSLSSLLAYKMNSKLALSLPILLFAPLAIGGNLILPNTNPTNDHVAYYLNDKYKYHPAGNALNAEMFYLNNNKDEFYIIPNGADYNKFNKNELAYINKALELSKTSALDWQAYSWSIIPYQMVDIFNINNINTFSPNISPKNNLSDYLYHSNLENVVYSYKTDLNNNLIRLNVLDNDKYYSKYIVPGMLKDNNTINKNSKNSGVFYARKGADDFKCNFDEDNLNFSAPNNLVGKLTWDNMVLMLKDPKFNEFSKDFYQELFKNWNPKYKNDLFLTKKYLLDSITVEINNKTSKLYNIVNNNIPVFDSNAVKNKLLSSEIERKLYFATGLMYYLYFNFNDSFMLKALLANDADVNAFTPSIINIKIDKYIYQIGGISQYEPIQSLKTISNDEKRPITRFELYKDNNNHLFQTVDNVVSIKRDKTIVNKYYYLLIWASASILFLGLNGLLYKRKDYK